MHLQPQDALVDIYREHFDFVWSVLRRLGVDPRDLEDVAQEVFLVVHRRLGEFEGRSSVKTWLYAIAVRLALNHNRRRQRRPKLAESSWSSLPAPTRHADPEDHAARSEAEEILLGLLDKLDPDKRVVFVLSEIEGLPAHEIARVVGAKTRTVYSRLRAARERFAVDLQRTHARDERWRSRELMRRSGYERAPGRSRDTVWAAVAVRLTEATVPSALAPIGVAWIAKSALATIGIAAGGLGLVVMLTLPLVEASPGAPTARSSASVESPAQTERAEVLEAGTASATPDPVIELASPGGLEAKTYGASAHSSSPSRPSSKSPLRPEADPPTATLDDDGLGAEVDLLRRARSALAQGDAADALRLLDQHAAEYPKSALERDRDRTRVTVLCRLGRTEEARRAAGDPKLRCEAG